MTTPIENCPQGDEPIRERAWTAEQKKSAETQALIEAYLDWDEAREGVCTNLECFKAGAAYGAALAQNAQVEAPVGSETCATVADAVRIADKCRSPDDEGVVWVPESCYLTMVGEVERLEALLYTDGNGNISTHAEPQSTQDEAVADGMQPSRPKPHMPISPLGPEDFCFCDNHVSLQSIAGGGSPDGYLGSARLKIDGEFVTYVRSDLHAERSRVSTGWRETILAVIDALDKATGDSDPNIDPDMTDEEVRDEYPEVWSMQQLTAMLAADTTQPEGAPHA